MEHNDSTNSSKGLIVIENLFKEFTVSNNKLHVLNNVNLVVENRDIYGIIGLSGAGKSTLVRCINLLEKPTSGKIFFDNQELTGLNKKELNLQRRKMGMIFQNFNLFDQKTVYKNVAYPLEIDKVDKVAIKERVNYLLNLVGLSDKANEYPTKLSGGQKQRVAIARALANNPKVLLCDEPTSALDPTTTEQILALLEKINLELGVTIIIITHEMKIVESICNKVSIIHKSEIVESGYVKEIFKNPKSRIAKKLILPDEGIRFQNIGDRYLRLVYDGTVFDPIISNLIIDCRCQINILSSNVKTFEGKTFGQMIIQIPEGEDAFVRICNYLKNKNVEFKEVNESDIRNNIADVD